MIGGSEKRNGWLHLEHQSPCVIERCSIRRTLPQILRSELDYGHESEGPTILTLNLLEVIKHSNL